MLSVLAGLPGMAQPWDVRRFAQTAIFFNAPGDVLKRLAPPNPFLKPNVIGKDGLVWSNTNRMLEFGSLDDVVMGGVSQSSFAITPAGIGRFQGEVSTENNGGFAGVRSKALTPALQLGSFQALKLRVKGDGSRYKFIVRDSYDWNGCAALHSLRHSHDTQREPPSRWQNCMVSVFRYYTRGLARMLVTLRRFRSNALRKVGHRQTSQQGRCQHVPDHLEQV